MKAKKYTSMLGLAFEGRHLDLCLMQRRGGRTRVEKSLRVPLLLDPLSGEPELVGREIRNQLDAAGIRERNCAVCLPLKWMLTMQSELPELEGEDLDSFIAMQAERSFPFAPEDLMMSTSRLKTANGTGMATVVALSRNSVAHLQAVFREAKLKPVTFTLGLATLPLPLSGVVLLAGEGGLDLAVSAGGGYAAIRLLDEALAEGSEGREWDFELIAQQLRITLGRLPAGVRSGLGTVHVYGPLLQVSELINGLQDMLAQMGLKITAGVGEAATAQGISPAMWSPAAGVAALCLAGDALAFDFLPPYVSRLKQLVSRISARSALYLGGSAAVILLGLSAMFVMQGMKLSRLQNQWALMKPHVDKVELFQRKVRNFRPWFESSPESLSIARTIAQAFPEAGSVWVKSIEIKDLNKVTCNGSARSNQDWLEVLTSLQKFKEIDNVQVLQVSGNNPLKFSVSFNWKGGTGNAR